jgi:2-amino-4-hydroxy-6-hydroxymethyldihydropteridine diphosphokinase
VSVAYLSLGSNIDADGNIRSAMKALQDTFEAVEFSPLYRSPPWGFEGRDFINLAARIETGLSPLQLKHWLTALEDRHGRRRDVPSFSDRTLDIDILLYDDLHLLSPELELPRGEILEAAYVLRPLAELAPDLLHPVERRTLADLWRTFPGPQAQLEPIEP